MYAIFPQHLIDTPVDAEINEYEPLSISPQTLLLIYPKFPPNILPPLELSIPTKD